MARFLCTCCDNNHDEKIEGIGRVTLPDGRKITVCGMCIIAAMCRADRQRGLRVARARGQ